MRLPPPRKAFAKAAHACALPDAHFRPPFTILVKGLKVAASAQTFVLQELLGHLNGHWIYEADALWTPEYRCLILPSHMHNILHVHCMMLCFLSILVSSNTQQACAISVPVFNLQQAVSGVMMSLFEVHCRDDSAVNVLVEGICIEDRQTDQSDRYDQLVSCFFVSGGVHAAECTWACAGAVAEAQRSLRMPFMPWTWL